MRAAAEGGEVLVSPLNDPRMEYRGNKRAVTNKVTNDPTKDNTCGIRSFTGGFCIDIANAHPPRMSMAIAKIKYAIRAWVLGIPGQFFISFESSKSATH
jgi:hypothetical protein